MLRNALARKIGVDTQEKYDILVLEGIPSHKEGTLPSPVADRATVRSVGAKRHLVGSTPTLDSKIQMFDSII